LNFVVVGGGPTGVELAGAIADISRTVLLKDFRRIDPAKASIILIEAGSRLLSAFPERLSERAARDLADLGVEIRLGSRVNKIDARGVELNGTRLPAETVIWAAGVQASAVGRKLGVELDRAGRIKVQPDLSLAGHPEAFAVGDVAHFELGDGSIVPGLAPAAIQMGRTAAANVRASVHGKARKVFRYRDKGIMATIGKHKAVANTGKLNMTGFLAWLAWLFVHILYLVGFKNRITVFLEWAWSYTFSKRGARLITSRDWKST
jgi:NADH dehydrogenase